MVSKKELSAGKTTFSQAEIHYQRGRVPGPFGFKDFVSTLNILNREG